MKSKMGRAIDCDNTGDKVVGCERLGGLVGLVLKSDSKLAVERSSESRMLRILLENGSCLSF